MPATTSEAQYSLGFALAAYLVHGRIGPDEITGEALHDPRVAAMHARITLREEPRHSARFPEGRWSDVTVRLTGDREVHSGDCNARGGPEGPMPEADIRAKLSVMAGGALSEGRIAALWEMRHRLLDQGTEFSQLASLVTPGPDRP
jgi:2-methylcitrate dehydratase PrpD